MGVNKNSSFAKGQGTPAKGVDINKKGKIRKKGKKRLQIGTLFNIKK